MTDTTTTIRETCLICGMVANLDPTLHEERYEHAPRVKRGNVILYWVEEVQDFMPVPMDEYRTPALVHEFAFTREAIGAGVKRTQADHKRLSDVVLELRRRGILD